MKPAVTLRIAAAANGTLAVAAIGLGVFHDYRQQARAAAPLLPVTFAHKTHTTVNCVACHHNYIDDSGQGLCFNCHKSDPEVASVVEEQFHELCWGCHVEKQALGEDHGPIRQCLDCHQADEDA
jgi:hypothetical protein